MPEVSPFLPGGAVGKQPILRSTACMPAVQLGCFAGAVSDKQHVSQQKQETAESP